MGGEVKDKRGDKHKGPKGQNRESGLKVISEGDNTIQFLFHKQNGREGARLGREGLGGPCRYEAVKALVCGSRFRSWFGGCGDGGTQLDWGHYY